MRLILFINLDKKIPGLQNLKLKTCVATCLINWHSYIKIQQIRPLGTCCCFWGQMFWTTTLTCCHVEAKTLLHTLLLKKQRWSSFVLFSMELLTQSIIWLSGTNWTELNMSPKAKCQNDDIYFQWTITTNKNKYIWDTLTLKWKKKSLISLQNITYLMIYGALPGQQVVLQPMLFNMISV